MTMMRTSWHFPIMILGSLVIFVVLLRFILSKEEFRKNFTKISLLSFIVVVLGMIFGKYGAMAGLPWWIYYPVPLLMTVLLPPVVLKFSPRQTVVYLIFSFLSAPFIHVLFSFFLGWTEYMPFLKIPFMGS